MMNVLLDKKRCCITFIFNLPKIELVRCRQRNHCWSTSLQQWRSVLLGKR